MFTFIQSKLAELKAAGPAGTAAIVAAYLHSTIDKADLNVVAKLVLPSLIEGHTTAQVIAILDANVAAYVAPQDVPIAHAVLAIAAGLLARQTPPAAPMVPAAPGA